MQDQFNARDVTWLAFNERVMQEAMDESVPLHIRIRFLGIFSNNLDEFFRVRVAGLKRAMDFKDKIVSDSFFQPPSKILKQIHKIVVKHQEDFNDCWEKIQAEMAENKVFIKTHKDLTDLEKRFVVKYFDEEVESNVIPILLNSHTAMPYLRDKSLYIGVAMRRKSSFRFFFSAAFENFKTNSRNCHQTARRFQCLLGKNTSRDGRKQGIHQNL